ncbi:MAG TPA: SDR family NAD(P)-dependent oxidoreductase, partial [Rhodothermales bacterium]|nr:SDR family NAD(P)-dependent oxidoreductase [Rhodothermales bacterium]
MDLLLRDRVAVVTGASRGLGLAIARALADEGCHLLLVARGEAGLRAAAEALSSYGVRVETIALDITDAASSTELAEAVRSRFGRLDVLVGNAGTNRRKPFAETTDDDWQTVAEVNVFAHLRTARALLPLLEASDAASILFTASIFGREAGGAGLSIYNATKSALI